MSRLSEYTYTVENAGNKSIVAKYVLDDGWDEKHPEEIIEIINLEIKKSYSQAMANVRRQRMNHKGAWLTEETAREYEAKSWIYRALYDNQYINEVRELGTELQEQCGVTELEAINILNGNHIKEYVDKYYKIKNLIPPYVNVQRICDRVVRKYECAKYECAVV